MDAGGAGDDRFRSLPRHLLPVDGRSGGHRRCSARRDMAVRRPDGVSRRSFRSAVDRVTRGRAPGEPAIERSSGACGKRGGPARAAADRAAHLALFRDLRHRRGQHAPAGQFPGRAVAGSRPPHFAHQSRPLSPLDGQRARLRLDGCARHDRAARGDDGGDGEARAISRPFLQLVRYGKSPCPRPAICLFGRQRQSGWTSHRARQCLPGMVREAARRSTTSRRDRRCSRSRPGRGRSAAGPTPHRNRHLASARRVGRSSPGGSGPGPPSRAKLSPFGLPRLQNLPKRLSI